MRCGSLIAASVRVGQSSVGVGLAVAVADGAGVVGVALGVGDATTVGAQAESRSATTRSLITPSERSPRARDAGSVRFRDRCRATVQAAHSHRVDVDAYVRGPVH
jgi:hypothetical protein